MKRPITTTEDQSTRFIELFFDLVFVYAVTQTVSLMHQELSWTGVAHALIVFWLVWWAWTQCIWALNSADTTHPAVEAIVLVATAIAFLMAVTIPDAFGDAGGWFAATYSAVRVVGLALYGRVAWDDGILHLVVVFGVVLLAVALQEAVAHPHEALPVRGSLALAGAVVLFVGGTAATLRRSGNALSGRRLVILAAVAAGVWLTHGAPVTWSLLVVVLGLLLLVAAERATGKRRDELERGTLASEVGCLSGTSTSSSGSSMRPPHRRQGSRGAPPRRARPKAAARVPTWSAECLALLSAEGWPARRWRSPGRHQSAGKVRGGGGQP